MTKQSTIRRRLPSWKVWKNVAASVFVGVAEKNLGTLAAGMAFFATLSFFPLIASLVAVGGIVLEPHQMSDVGATFAHYLPQDIANLITTQLNNATQHKVGNIFVAIISFVLAVFSISGAVNAAQIGTNVAYNIKETRSIVRFKLVGMLWTFGLIIALAVLLPILFVNEAFLLKQGFSAALTSAYSIVRWLALILLAVIGLAFFYHYGPNRSRTKFQWFSWGAIIATVLWLFVTAGFFVYLQYFADFSDSYSLFAGIIAMMLWLNLTSFIILIGAEINYQLDEHGAH